MCIHGGCLENCRLAIKPVNCSEGQLVWLLSASGAGAARTTHWRVRRNCAVHNGLHRRLILLPDSSAPACSAQTYKDKVAEAEKAQAKAIGNHAKRAKAARQLAGVLKKLDKQGKLTAEQRESAEAKLLDAQDVIQDIEQIKPSTGSIFVRLFLGQVNVKATTSKDR